MKAGRLLVMLALVALGAGLFAWSGPASAHDQAYDSKVTIHEPQPATYRGRVKSEKRGCVRNRLVKLYNASGDKYAGFSDETDDEGRWQITIFGAEYYAKVTREVKTPGNHRHVCRADTSPTA
jgi:hypothetical protein